MTSGRPGSDPFTTRTPRVVAARRLQRRRERTQARRFLAEGPQAVREAGPAVVELFGTPDALDRHGLEPRRARRLQYLHRLVELVDEPAGGDGILELHFLDEGGQRLSRFLDSGLECSNLLRVGGLPVQDRCGGGGEVPIQWSSQVRERCGGLERRRKLQSPGHLQQGQSIGVRPAGEPHLRQQVRRQVRRVGLRTLLLRRDRRGEDSIQHLTGGQLRRLFDGQCLCKNRVLLPERFAGQADGTSLLNRALLLDGLTGAVRIGRFSRRRLLGPAVIRIRIVGQTLHPAGHVPAGR